MSDKEKVGGEEVMPYDLVDGFIQPYPDGDFMHVAQHQRITEALRGEVGRLTADLAYFPSTVRQLSADCTALRAQLAQQPGVPDGWKLVPVEPTEAIRDALYTSGFESADSILNYAYKAMLAAAPAPVQAEPASPWVASGYILLTSDQIERHATTAWECPKQSRVVLVRSLYRLAKKNADALPPAPEVV
jgi:hypothetical protein